MSFLRSELRVCLFQVKRRTKCVLYCGYLEELCLLELELELDFELKYKRCKKNCTQLFNENSR